MYHRALLKGERHMTTKAKKKYTYLTKAIQLPDGTRKYIRGKDQKELEEKVLKAQIMVNAGVDICSEETFGHFAQMWYDIYKKPYLRENSQNAIKYVMNQHILPYTVAIVCGTSLPCRFNPSWQPFLTKAILSSQRC